MRSSSWFVLALVPVGGLLSAGVAATTPGYRHSFSPSYRNSDVCPERCSVSGPVTGNWSVYPNFGQIKRCEQTMFYDFSLYDQVDDQANNHRIYACSSFGPDFSNMLPSSARIASAKSMEVEFEVGWQGEGFGLATSDIRSLVKQMRTYINHGYGATDRPFIFYGKSGQATIGLYIGKGLLNQGLSESALKLFQDNLENLNVSTPSLAMQLCSPHFDSNHIFGVITTSNGTFSHIQNAITSWANATCLTFSKAMKFSGSAMFLTSLHDDRTNKSTVLVQESRYHVAGECRTVLVEPGNGCADLAVKCGISPADFTRYNPGVDFCSKLRPKQHVCCSSGNLPDFRPQPNKDGSCKSYQVRADENCDGIAAEYSLTQQDLEDFNKNTWGWNGCRLLFKDALICLSKGAPPSPAPIANAVCGPQKPGSKPTTDGSDISALNPCPLNACCNIWGQCGITKDFCIDTNTASPGTAKPGTYGCISNCGLDVVKGDGAGAIKIAYYEGYCFSRECLFQDASQIDTSQYTHIHFGFGALTTSFVVEVGDTLSSYQFGEFKRISGVKKVLSFGGWDFSTMPATYKIFRNGVKPENRLTMAMKIADFIKRHELDGVDIDWEYPGAPDLPEFDPGSLEEGSNYLAFLVILKNLLPGKSISIAAPSSYWYLKQFPIKEIGKVVDYIVYMTYDLHGQWDAHNSNSQEGCERGNCLRSQINLTETKQSLAMITKAGVPGKKVIVGVASYGRSFKMSEAGCWGPDCTFVGDRFNSKAKKGKCTGTAGNSDILVYDGTEWVGYMSSATKNTRTTLYAAWGLGGTSDWATDLQQYHGVPPPAKSWTEYKKLAMSGQDPKTDHTRSGNWTKFDCTHPLIVNVLDHTPSERWTGLNADAAWNDVVRIWKETDRERGGVKFMESVSSTLHMGAQANCGSLNSDSCVTKDCPKSADGSKSGPAAQFIWNSLVQVHLYHKDYHKTLYEVAAISSTALKDLENRLAPIPPKDDKHWLLLLLDLVGLGTLSVAGPFFNSVLKKLPYFLEKIRTFDNIKDTTMTVIGQSMAIAKDMTPSKNGTWTPEAQDVFSNYMGQVIDGWANVTSQALELVFKGNNESIDILSNTISGGKLIEGKFERNPPESGDKKNELKANIAKCFFGYSIPALWQVSKAHTFVIDSGYGCDVDKPLQSYLSNTTMDATGVCVDGNRYYLAYPHGAAQDCYCKHAGYFCERKCIANVFSAPPGLDSLGGGNFGGITKEDLVKGSIRTWIQNGKKNGGSSADPTKKGTIDNLLNVDITTPGFIRIPVCSPERAFKSWDTARTGSNSYPCDIPLGMDTCGESTFEDQTNDASPSIDDCLAIIKNIQPDTNTNWVHEVLGKNQRKIASAGSCSFGVEATKVHGNVNFVVGGQDVIDIIQSAINRFGREGKVAAKGEMGCSGNMKSQPVKWGIYK
ncbi:chitinase [Aspergillus avenaceus]|uniref:chitinase n=1 Tax=Aspergillus avenaceus TaxID=36643 RepID=A0A5N6U0A0_ASPAV|nr:chitinase [Aspergillus avenaceus]